MTAPIPSAPGTGLTGDWFLGPVGGVRMDLGVCPPDIVVRDPAAAWSIVRDLLTAVPKKKTALEAPRRWRAARSVHGRPVRHGGAVVLADADGYLYAAPSWLGRVLLACPDARLGVLPTEDTHHHQDVLVVRQRGDVVAFVGVRRLGECAG